MALTASGAIAVNGVTGVNGAEPAPWYPSNLLQSYRKNNYS